MGSERPEMLEPKTRFEQIPLETVKKIVEKQLRQEEAAEAARLDYLQVVACAARAQTERRDTVDGAFLPAMLRLKQAASVQEFTFTNVTKSLSGTPLEMKPRFARRASR